MLVLSRKVGEKILIGDDIVLSVSKIQGSKVTIGIDAPKHVRIIRSEIDIDVPELAVDQVAPKSNRISVAR